MIRITTLLAFVCATFNMFSQSIENTVKEGVIYPIEFHVSRPLSDIAREHPFAVARALRHPHESEDRQDREPQHFIDEVKNGGVYGNDPSTIQNEPGNVTGKSPILNIAGQYSSSFRPFDPSGAAGLTQYVQMINSTTLKVFNKSTGAATLTATLGNLWPTATPNDGDPIVMYDKAADRWFLAQFGQTGNKIYIAISTTGSATGTYYCYTFSSTLFPDYLKFSVWQDAYYMTANFNTSERVFAFERTAMLAGVATARSVFATFNPPNGGYFFCPLSGDASDSQLPPAGTPCPIFSYSDNGWGGSFSDAINIYKVTVNWVPSTPTMSITSAGTVPTAAFNAQYSSAWNDVSQPGTTQKLDAIGGVLMFRAQWRPWTSAGYNSVVLNWSVYISASQRSIKWCELRQNQTTGVWSMYQEGIYTPDSYTRWMGSIAMDDNGSIGLCYLKSGASTVYPSLCYAGRRVCDALGTLPVAEVIAKAGTGSQTGGDNRVGDYSATVLDPDGLTFWHTGEYMSTSGSGAARTQIYSFQLSPCVTVPPIAGFNYSSLNICAGGTGITFTDTSANYPSGWSWSFPGGSPTSSTLQNPVVNYTTSGTYTVSLTSSNSLGSNTTSATINVVVSPTPTVVISNDTICSGTTATLSASGATSYTWSSGVTSTGVNTGTVFPVSTTTYSVTGTTGVCSATSPVTVVVNAKPTVTNSPLSHSICTGNAFTLNLTSGVASTTFAYTASTASTTITGFTASGSGNISDVMVNTGTAGIVTYIITPTGPAPTFCVGNSSTHTVFVYPMPATPTITQLGATLTSSASSGNQWYLNGTLISGATSTTFTITANGTYTVIVSNPGCSSSVSNSIVVTNAGIEEFIDSNSFEVFPNPNHGEFVVSFESSAKATFVIDLYNDLGQIVFSQTLKNAVGKVEVPLNVTSFAKGIYFVRIKNNKNLGIKKVEVN